MIAYGPVPSRRLGRSLGVNNIPHKICSYSCVYCQVGRTRHFQVERSSFFDPSAIAAEVGAKVVAVGEAGETIDFISFVPDGEPTLDVNLASTIERLKPLGTRIAVITNGSLMAREDVRSALGGADWVSLKVDAVTTDTWRRINRPHRALRLEGILEGMLEFRRAYKGTLATETMLVRDLNDDDGSLESVAEFIGRLRPDVAFLSIPTRPPAEPWVRQPSEEIVTRAHGILARHAGEVEHLIGYEGNAFAFTGNPEDDLLSITAVHPMREEAVRELLRKTQADWSVVRSLVREDRLVETAYDGRTYYIRKFSKGGRGFENDRTVDRGAEA